MQLVISSYGETIANRTLTRFSDAVADPVEGLQEVATIMREAVEGQFESEGERASGGWKPLTPERVEAKQRLGLDPHILRATDALMNSLTLKFDPNHIERITGSALVFGSTVAYGIYHQSTLPRHVIPYRPPVALTEVDRREMVKVLQASMIEAARA